MPITFNWTINTLNCYTEMDGKKKVVFSVNWSCSGIDNQYSAFVYGACPLSASEGTFISYDQLTQEQVLGWIWANGVDKDSTEAAVQQQIDNQINPPVLTPPLPWASTQYAV